MTLLRLAGPAIRPLGPSSPNAFFARVATRATGDDREREVFFAQHGTELPAGYRAYFVTDSRAAESSNVFLLSEEFRYLAQGDVVRVDPARRTIATLYRRASPSNSLLVTERCDNFCLMCSQPPKTRDDSAIVDDLIDSVIALISPETRELGITGGEPGVLGQRLLDLIGKLQSQLPTTALHLLTNGRAFAREDFASSLGALCHPDLMLGIPIYSDLPEEHDYVVQARGAFDETIRGILHLKRAGVRVEVRMVIHKQTYGRLPDFARFVARNLTFVDHVALMGLELMGFARSNIDVLWVDPLDYQSELVSAVRTLVRAGVPTSIYNHQLCVLSRDLWPYARKSISDWKNTYHDACGACDVQSMCGGSFASSSLRASRGISALK
jgi:His-Xaa-Ser system radical SAM maturase HxsC